MILEFYNKLSAEEKKVFFIALGILVIAFFDALFLRPVLSRLSGMDTDISEKAGRIRNDMRYLSYEPRIIAEDEAYRAFSADEAKTEEEIIAGFLRTVESLASESNVSIVKLNPSGLQQKKGYVLYYTVLECAGRLSDMAVFMHKIDSTNSLLRITKFNLSGKKASAEDVAASMKISKLIIDPNTVGNYDFSDKELLSKTSEVQVTGDAKAEGKEPGAKKTGEEKKDNAAEPGQAKKPDASKAAVEGKNPGEKTDLATSQPDRVKQLQALWDGWNARNEPPRWIDNRWNGDGPQQKKAAAKKPAQKRPVP